MSDRRLAEIEQANVAVPRLHPSPADVEYLLERVRAAEATLEKFVGVRLRLSQHESDLVAAAGECLVPIPEPGTDLARLLMANRLLRVRLEAEEKRAHDLRELALIFAAETHGGVITCLNCRKMVRTEWSSAHSHSVPSPRDRGHESWCPLFEGATP